MYKIKEYRVKKSLKQKELAKRAGISVNSIRRYESGKRSPKADVICKIANSLGCTPNDLLGVEEIVTEQEVKAE